MQCGGPAAFVSSIHEDEFMVMPQMMQAARLYDVDSDMQLEEMVRKAECSGGFTNFVVNPN